MYAAGRVLISLVLMSGAAAISAQPTWLPPEVEQGLVKQLAERMAKSNPVTAEDPARASSAASRIVQNLAKDLGLWTDAVALGWAPTFPLLKLPTANQQHLDAMNRYQVCNLVYFMQFESSKDAEILRRSSLGLTAMTMAVLRLRQPFVKAGGTDERIEAFLTSPPMDKVMDQIQLSSELTAHVERQCQGVLWELILKPGR